MVNVVTERWTSLSGVRIRYLDSRTDGDAEPGGQLPVLLSPGFTDFADEYAEVLAFFAPRRVIVVEVRGRGGSEAPFAGYTAGDHVADLRAVLDAEGIGHFHLLTFSRGTTWGLDLVISDPGRAATISIGDYWMAEHALDGSMAEQVMASRFRGRPMTERLPSHVAPALFGASRDRDLRAAVAATGLPVLVATGTEAGCLLTREYLDELSDVVPGMEVVVIDRAAHDLFRPDRLAYPRAVREFIERRAPAT